MPDAIEALFSARRGHDSKSAHLDLFGPRVLPYLVAALSDHRIEAHFARGDIASAADEASPLERICFQLREMKTKGKEYIVDIAQHLVEFVHSSVAPSRWCVLQTLACFGTRECSDVVVSCFRDGDPPTRDSILVGISEGAAGGGGDQEFSEAMRPLVWKSVISHDVYSVFAVEAYFAIDPGAVDKFIEDPVVWRVDSHCIGQVLSHLRARRLTVPPRVIRSLVAQCNQGDSAIERAYADALVVLAYNPDSDAKQTISEALDSRSSIVREAAQEALDVLSGVSRAMESVQAIVNAQGMDALSLSQRQWYLLMRYDMEVRADGHLGFVIGTTAGRWKEVLDGLEAIGALRHKEFLADVIEAFGNGGPADDLDARQTQLRSLTGVMRRACAKADREYIRCQPALRQLLARQSATIR